MKRYVAADLLLTPSQAARRTGIPAATIRNYMDRGLLPSERIGPRKRAWRRVRLKAVVDLIREVQRSHDAPHR